MDYLPLRWIISQCLIESYIRIQFSKSLHLGANWYDYQMLVVKGFFLFPEGWYCTVIRFKMYGLMVQRMLSVCLLTTAKRLHGGRRKIVRRTSKDCVAVAVSCVILGLLGNIMWNYSCYVLQLQPLFSIFIAVGLYFHSVLAYE